VQSIINLVRPSDWLRQRPQIDLPPLDFGPPPKQ
jgi:hypothetical protein